MDRSALQSVVDLVFDQALVHHGYVNYMRDYELIVYCTADPRTGVRPTHERLLFKNCVQASVDTALSEEIWSRSLDDRLIDYETGVDLDGYVWGVNWQLLYPGARVVDGSTAAHSWSDTLGIDFHEVRIETNCHNLQLTFSDIEVSQVLPGYSPFVVSDGGPDFKYYIE